MLLIVAIMAFRLSGHVFARKDMTANKWRNDKARTKTIADGCVIGGGQHQGIRASR